MSWRKKGLLHAGLIGIGGLLYVLIELLWRRRSHPSMFVVGGICFDLIGTIHRRCTRRCTAVRCGLCAAAVTAVELVSGLILNRWWRLDVWDYSGQPLNIGGQVCLLYTGFWMALAWLAYPVYEWCYRFISRGLGIPHTADRPRT